MSDLAAEPVPDAAAEPEDSPGLLAADLRALRLEADSPTLVRLQSETGISRSVLSEAFAGKTLPTARTLDRLVRACGGDPTSWIARRDRIAHAIDPRGTDVQVEVTRAPRRTMRRGTAIVLCAAALLVGSFVSGVTSGLVVATLTRDQVAAALPKAVNERAQINVASGLDAAQTPCVDDAKVATGAQRNNVLIEIIWSNKCYAGWARITRYDAWENESVSVSLYPETAANGPLRQTASLGDVQGVYTPLIVRPTENTLLCAVGSYTVGGESVDAGDPICI